MLLQVGMLVGSTFWEARTVDDCGRREEGGGRRERGSCAVGRSRRGGEEGLGRITDAMSLSSRNISCHFD